MTTTLSAHGSVDVGVTMGTEFTVAASGAFGSGTVTVNYRAGNSWVTFSSGETGTATSAFERVFENVGDIDTVRITLAEATSPTISLVVNSSRF
jgi:hypothetical protein